MSEPIDFKDRGKVVRLHSGALGDLYKAAKSALFILDNTKLGDVEIATKLRKAIAKAEGKEP